MLSISDAFLCYYYVDNKVFYSCYGHGTIYLANNCFGKCNVYETYSYHCTKMFSSKYSLKVIHLHTFDFKILTRHYFIDRFDSLYIRRIQCASWCVNINNLQQNDSVRHYVQNMVDCRTKQN